MYPEVKVRSKNIITNNANGPFEKLQHWIPFLSFRSCVCTISTDPVQIHIPDFPCNLPARQSTIELDVISPLYVKEVQPANPGNS